MDQTEKAAPVTAAHDPPGPRRDAKGALRRLAGGAAVCAIVLGGFAGVLYGITVLCDAIVGTMSGLAAQAEAAAPGLVRNALLWLATDKTVADINIIGTQWGGALAIIAIVLSIILFLMSR